MNCIDKITVALTPGSPMNRNGHVFRSISTLAQFAGLNNLDDVLEILNGDMAGDVTIKPSKNLETGLLAALTANIPPPGEEGPADLGEAIVQAMGENAVPPALNTPNIVEAGMDTSAAVAQEMAKSTGVIIKAPVEDDTAPEAVLEEAVLEFNIFGHLVDQARAEEEDVEF